jgi:hypothetical protein
VFLKILKALLGLNSANSLSQNSKEEPKVNTPRLVETRRTHVNNGNCPKCEEIIDKYPGCNPLLVDWFIQLQKRFPDAHVSCAGRGKKDQDDAKKRGASRAGYGESSHNYNQALDIFRLHANGAEWPKEWFNTVVGNNLPEWIEWYGKPNSRFFELPHIEVKAWRSIKDKKLVE